MIAGGFGGRVLHVDLSRGTIDWRPLELDAAERFLGGLGMCIQLAHQEIVQGADPLSPENIVVLGAGPLVGTNAPSSSRVYAVSKLPASRTVGWCGAGGFTFGRHFKAAGVDHVIITGKANRPVYLSISDQQAYLKDASSIWGLTIDETYNSIVDKYGGDVGVLAIGPAGESGAVFSMAYIDRISTLGRGGLGAVLGSKNLKAVVVMGTGGVRVARHKAYGQLIRQMVRTIGQYRYLKEWQDLGMIKSFPTIDVETYRRIRVRRLACISCPVGCKDLVRIPDGEFQGVLAYSSSVINLWTPVIYGMRDYRCAVKLVSELDGYGLDMFEFFGVMAFAKRLGGEGLIPSSELTPEIDLSSYPSLSIWAKKIAHREGLGRLLADGFRAIIEAVGGRGADSAPALVKGMHPYTGPGSALPWNLFGTMELGQILDPRGPHVGSGGSPTYFAKRPMEVFPKHLLRMGVPEEELDRILPTKDHGLLIGRLLRYSHRWFTILGSLGVCARAQINRFYNARLCADLYEAVTGIPTDLHQLRQRADRAWTLLRMINVREGLRPDSHEALPKGWFQGNGFKEYVSEEPLSEEDARKMAEDYYEEWRWDPKTGVPTPQRLKELGLV